MEQRNRALRILPRIGLWSVAVVYAYVLVKIILLKYGWNAGLRSFNFVPFRFVADFLRHDVSVDVSLKNILGNFALFLPLGILCPALFRKLDRWWKGALVGLIVSAACELLQCLFGLGATDIDDLILNTLGTAVGSGLYFGLFARLSPRWKAQAVSLGFLCAIGLLGLLALWLYAPNELPPVVKTVNAEALDGLDPSSYAYTGVLDQIAEDGLTFTNAYAADGSAAPPLTHAFSADTRFYGCTISYQMSPNGNIQKTFRTYQRLDAAAARKTAIAHAPLCADLWIDEGGLVTAVVLTMYQD